MDGNETKPSQPRNLQSKMCLPVVQGDMTWPSNIHASSKERGKDFTADDCILDDGRYFVWGDPSIPDPSGAGEIDLRRRMIIKYCQNET